MELLIVYNEFIVFLMMQSMNDRLYHGVLDCEDSLPLSFDDVHRGRVKSQWIVNWMTFHQRVQWILME
jgi:hypothetical protein